MKKASPRPSDAISEPARLEIRLPGKATVGMAFRLIPAGSFRMGNRGESSNEEPIHEVRIEHPFWMAETPVTQAQFAVWTKAEGIDHQNEFHDPLRPENPAENLNWRQANSFCEWLSREVPRSSKNKLPDGFRWFCLPTEAEWEHACRAGTETDYYTGDGDSALQETGWFGEKWGSGSPHPVRKKSPNAFHLYDLHGNVLEWCHDPYESDAYRAHVDGDPDPGAVIREFESGEGAEELIHDDRGRVMRGGTWDASAWGCRSAFRNFGRPVDRSWIVGFRVCLVRGPISEGGARVADQSAKAAAAPEVAGGGTTPETPEAAGAGAMGVAPSFDLSSESFSHAAGPRDTLKPPTFP